MIDHPNRDRKFAWRGIMNASPGDKSHRKEIDSEVIETAKKLRRLVDLFQLTEKQIYDIIKEEFGEGVGYQTTRIFLNQTYGPGFNCRATTLMKYKYLIRYLKRLKKQFAKSTLSSRLSNVQVDKLKKNKPTN